MKRYYFIYTLFVLVTLLSYFNIYSQINYPVARKQAFDTVIYNKKLSDEYGWMSLPAYEKEMKEYALQRCLAKT